MEFVKLKITDFTNCVPLTTHNCVQIDQGLQNALSISSTHREQSAGFLTLNSTILSLEPRGVTSPLLVCRGWRNSQCRRGVCMPFWIPVRSVLTGDALCSRHEVRVNVDTRQTCDAIGRRPQCRAVTGAAACLSGIFGSDFFRRPSYHARLLVFLY